MRATLKLVEKPSEIKKKMAELLCGQVVDFLQKRIPFIRSGIVDILEFAILTSPEMESLFASQGHLRGELGLTDPHRRMKEILQMWISSIRVRLEKRTTISTFNISIIAEAIRGDYSDVLGVEPASFISENGHLVPWLEWLLTSGTTTVVSTHHIEYDLTRSQQLRSRTGLALMVAPGSYRLPSEFAGTQNDNFVTRAIHGSQLQFLKLLRNQFN